MALFKIGFSSAKYVNKEESDGKTDTDYAGKRALELWLHGAQLSRRPEFDDLK
ncbi:hypothetical protein DPMN_164953 [Dreissena polymorpha]|uniref:Uncharacterized protein n=1 Tax=Dreissena polymorpha TaxID=45954 RepID=A0A9D4EZF6_DREPO|nr:hypothetical protein DPMN_164953 [Dreissena polymorpha]